MTREKQLSVGVVHRDSEPTEGVLVRNIKVGVTEEDLFWPLVSHICIIGDIAFTHENPLFMVLSRQGRENIEEKGVLLLPPSSGQLFNEPFLGLRAMSRDKGIGTRATREFRGDKKNWGEKKCSPASKKAANHLLCFWRVSKFAQLFQVSLHGGHVCHKIVRLLLRDDSK